MHDVKPELDDRLAVLTDLLTREASETTRTTARVTALPRPKATVADPCYEPVLRHDRTGPCRRKRQPSPLLAAPRSAAVRVRVPSYAVKAATAACSLFSADNAPAAGGELGTERGTGPTGLTRI